MLPLVSLSLRLLLIFACQATSVASFSSSALPCRHVVPAHINLEEDSSDAFNPFDNGCGGSHMNSLGALTDDMVPLAQELESRPAGIPVETPHHDTYTVPAHQESPPRGLDPVVYQTSTPLLGRYHRMYQQDLDRQQAMAEYRAAGNVQLEKSMAPDGAKW